MINWFFFCFCDLYFYRLLIFVKLIFVIFSLDILKKKIFELDIIYVYFVLYEILKRKGICMILIDNIYKE